MKKLVTDTLVITIGGLINRTKGLIFIPLIVGAIGFDGYGAFIQVFLLAKLVACLCSLEMGLGFQRFASSIEDSDPRELGRHFFSVAIPLALLATAGAMLLFFGAPTLSSWVMDGEHTDSLRVAAVVIWSNVGYGALRAFMFARKRFAQQTLFSLAYELLPYLGFVVATTLHASLLSGVVAYAVVDVLASGALLLYVLRSVRWQRPSLALAGTYVRYSAPLSLSNLEGSLLGKADRFFIGNLIGLEAVGLYNVAYRCSEVIGYLSIPLRSQMLTYLSSAWDRGHIEESKAVIRTTLLAFFGLTIGLLACVSVYFESLVPLLVGEHEAVPFLSLVVFLIGIGVIADGFRRFYYLFIRLHKRTVDELYYQLFGLVVNVVGNILLIPHFGLLGAAFSTFASYCLMMPLISWRYALDLDRRFAGHLLSFGVLALVIVPLRYALPDDGLVWVLAGGGAAYLVYVALVVLFKRRFLASVRNDLSRWQGVAL